MGRRAAVAACVASALAMVSAQSAHAALNLSSTFDTDNEGWTSAEGAVEPTPAGWEDGAIYVIDGSAPFEDNATFFAPSSWAGDATDNYGGTFEFDMKSTEDWSGGVTAVIVADDAEGPEDVLCFVDDAAPGAGFATHTFNLDTSDALNGSCTTPATSSQIVGVMSQLGQVVILADDIVAFGEVTYLDNVSLSGGGPPAPFDVQRDLSIDHAKVSSNFLNPFFAFFGLLEADDPPCAAHRKVVVYRKRKGPDEKLGTRTTNSEGAYRFAYDRKKGTYYAKSPEEDLGLPTCLEATSDTFKIN
jgi:hypothetical protein